MSEQIKLVNIFDQTERKIVCVANEHDYLGDGTIFKEENLVVGQEYTYIRGEAQSYGFMVHLKEVEEKHHYGFQAYLFEEKEPYDKEILKKEYETWLSAELDKGLESAKKGKCYTVEEMREHLGLLREKIKGRKDV